MAHDARVHDLLPGPLDELDRFREICARRRGCQAVTSRPLTRSCDSSNETRAAPLRRRRPRRGCMAGFMPNCNGDRSRAYRVSRNATFCHSWSSARRGNSDDVTIALTACRASAAVSGIFAISLQGRDCGIMLLTSSAHLVAFFLLEILIATRRQDKGLVVALSGARRSRASKRDKVFLGSPRDHIVGKLGLDDRVAPGRRAAELLQLRILAGHDDAGHADGLRPD